MAVYLLLGDDDERKSRSVEKLSRGRAADSFDAADSGPEAVLSACDSPSLFGDGAFVVLRNLDAWNAAQKAKIVAYLDDPAPETDLVMLGKSLGAREKLLSAVKKLGEVHELKQPTGKALAKWAAGYARKQGLDLPEEVAVELVSRCLDDKARVSREVEKLALYADDAATMEDLEVLVEPDLQSNIFAFVDALSAGDRRRALGTLETLLGTGEPPLRLVHMIRRQFRLLARAKSLLEDGTPRPELASRLKVPPFVARKLEEAAGRMGEDDLETALALVFDLERGLKGGSDLADELQVELTVLDLAR